MALCALATIVPVGGRADARTATPRALEVETYTLQNPDPSTGPTVFIADGAVWSMSGDDIHRVDPTTEPLVGYLTVPFGPYTGGQLDDGVFWSVTVDRDAAPCTTPRAEEDPDQPYVLRGVDVTGGTAARVVPLGWCGWYPTRQAWGARPNVVAAGGSVWTSRLVPPAPGQDLGATSGRLDPVTGVFTAVDPAEPLLVLGAAGDGGWGFVTTVTDPSAAPGPATHLTRYPLTRVGADGSVTANDMLRGAYWDPSALVADPDGVWVTSARHASRSARPLDPVLTRVATTGHVTTVAAVRPWSIATGDDGRTWFVGTTHRVTEADRSAPVDWVLGRVDTRTGKHLRTYHLDLPAEALTTGGSFPLVLLAATGGSVWLRGGQGAGVLVRVTEHET